MGGAMNEALTVRQVAEQLKPEQNTIRNWTSGDLLRQVQPFVLIMPASA
jgi:hypothetical protein